MPHRPTRDIDLLGFGLAEFPYLVAAFEDLCKLNIADGITFDAQSIRADEIRKDANYQGIRITLLGHLDGARCPVQIDVGYGDAVTPAPETADYPVILKDFPAPRLRVYLFCLHRCRRYRTRLSFPNCGQRHTAGMIEACKRIAAIVKSRFADYMAMVMTGTGLVTYCAWWNG